MFAPFHRLRLLPLGAAFLLLGCGGPSADDWIERLDHKDAAERSKAALALGRMGADAARSVPALVKLLKEGDVQGRWAAAEALRIMGPAAEEAIPALEAALQDADGDVREAAREALERIRRRKGGR